MTPRFRTPEDETSWRRTADASRHLADHFGEAPALVLFLLPIIDWTPVDDEGPMDIGPLYASVYPAVQNFMLAARDLGIGTALDDGRAHPPRRAAGTARHPRDDGGGRGRPDGPPDRKLRRRSPQAGRRGHPLGRVRQQAVPSEEGWSMAITSISDLARVHGVERRDNVALAGRRSGITYGELDERTNRVANALLAEGVDPQDRVAFLDKNGPEYFDVLIGAAKVNAVDVAVNWRLAAPEVAYIVNDSQSKVLHRGRGVRARARRDRGRPHHRQEDRRRRIASSARVVRGLDRSPRRAPIPGSQAGPDDVALQFYSSGTTGLPKGVMLTNTNLFTAMDGLEPRGSASARLGQPRRDAAVPHRRRRMGVRRPHRRV